ncbi:hypothetical protein AP071_16435 [Rhodobacter capsulatus]|nr:hypothetical protein AP071_16435 [Rhodobacter capsulatus]
MKPKDEQRGIPGFRFRLDGGMDIAGDHIEGHILTGCGRAIHKAHQARGDFGFARRKKVGRKVVVDDRYDMARKVQYPAKPKGALDSAV